MRRPICSTCNDTHFMPLGSSTVMCTRCPTPCQECRSGGSGPYCDFTPCVCGCHAPRPTLNARRFPIIGGPSIPWSLIAPHEGQAKINHDQTLTELARRGGLAPNELWCVVAGQKLRQLAPEADAKVWLAGWLAAHDDAVAEREIDRLRDCVSLQGSRASSAEQQLATARAEIERLQWAALRKHDDADAELQKLKLENYDLRRWADAPITSVEIYKGEATRARQERDAARAALREACDLLAIARLGDSPPLSLAIATGGVTTANSPPLREQADMIRKRGGL